MGPKDTYLKCLSSSCHTNDTDYGLIPLIDYLTCPECLIISENGFARQDLRVCLFWGGQEQRQPALHVAGNLGSQGLRSVEGTRSLLGGTSLLPKLGWKWRKWGWHMRKNARKWCAFFSLLVIFLLLKIDIFVGLWRDTVCKKSVRHCAVCDIREPQQAFTLRGLCEDSQIDRQVH